MRKPPRNPSEPRPTRRELLAGVLASGTMLVGQRPTAAVDPEGPARIAITLDLEMSRHYPTWDQTHWDYEKGNLDADTKAYAVEAARRVKAKGGRIHFFALGRTLEQEDVSWLEELIREGHPIGNHTYDHVNVKATQADQIQFRFQRAPWLIEGQEPSKVIAHNIRLTERALTHRLGIQPNGFRTPGGFHEGLRDRPDLQALLLEQGYQWVSSLYPPHPIGEPGQAPDREVIEAVVNAQANAQPFVYPSGLIEVPMSPISDVGAFRTGRWPLEAFLEVTRQSVQWAIDHRSVFDFLAHPSCLVVADPDFQTIELICDLVRAQGSLAQLVDLDAIAQSNQERS